MAMSGRTKSARLGAEEVGTSPGFSTQLMMPLVQQGWVGSDFDADDLNVLEVIEAVEGPTDTGRGVRT